VDQPQTAAVTADDLPWTTVVEPGVPSGAPGDAPVSMRRVIVIVTVAALVVLGIVAFVGSVIAKRTAERQGVHDAAVMTDLLATSAVQPRLTDAVLTNRAAAGDRTAGCSGRTTRASSVAASRWTKTPSRRWSRARSSPR
jgi:hypothetical protein